MYKVGDYFDLKQYTKTIVSRKEVNGYKDQTFEQEEIKFVVLNVDEEKRRNASCSREADRTRNNDTGTRRIRKRNRRARQAV